MALPFSQWSREAKDEYAKKRMDEMKLKNEQIKQRYAEVEQDRIKAEAKDSAVTSLKMLKKENIVIEKEKIEDIPKVIKEREWDRGKIDQDADDWSPPKFHGYHSRPQRRNFPDRRAPKKEENWRVRSANQSKDRQSYSKFRSGPNHKYQESSNYSTSGFRNENASFSRQRGRTHRTSSGTYRSFQNSRLDEPRKKSISGGADSASQSLSGSEMEPVKHQAKPDIDRMWQDGGFTEVQHKQSRVEKWVKAINTGSSWSEEYDNTKAGDYYAEKRGEAGPRDTVKGYGFTNEEGYTKKPYSSRDQTHLKSRDRYDGFKYGQSSRGNARARGSRTPTGDRTGGGFENKNQREFRRRNYTDKNRSRRESDLSDRTSSMKESDYHDCKFNKATSDSKSSDYSGKWEDEEYKYVPDKKSFEKQSSARNYGKDKFNKSKNIRTLNVSSSQDEIKSDGFDEEYDRNARQKFANNYDKPKTKNLRNADNSGFDDQPVDNRSSVRKFDYSFNKVKSNKYKTDSKFMGPSGKFENEIPVDNYGRPSRKYKTSKPSPKRTLSNPIKCVDTSSSASKTVEFNSPDEDIWVDYKYSGVAWYIDEQNYCQIEGKGNCEEETEPIKANCETNTDKLLSQDSESIKVEGKSEEAITEEYQVPNYVEEKKESLLGSVERNETDKNSACVAEGQRLDSGDVSTFNRVAHCSVKNIGPATCLSESNHIEKQSDEIACSVSSDEKHKCLNDNEECFDQKEVEVQIHQTTSSVENITVDICESEYLADTITDDKSSLPEVVCEVQNSPGEVVQSKEMEQTSSELFHIPNLEQSDLELVHTPSVTDKSASDYADTETTVGQTVENTVNNDKGKTEKNKIFSMSSQSTGVQCTKDDTESNLENSSGALNLSDDGGWSTVSEDENNDV